MRRRLDRNTKNICVAASPASPIRDRVKFLGYRNDIPNVLSRLDVLVQPNRGPEGLGRSVLEAMACGVPVVAVNKWGPAEVVQDGRSGLLFPPLDAAALAARMIALGEDLSLRANLGRNAHEWIRQNIVPIDLAGRFDQILTDSIASSTKEACVRMKVLQLGKFYDPVVGGIETVLQEICEQLHTRVQLQVLVANTRFRTEHEVREFPITRVASDGNCLFVSDRAVVPALGEKERRRSHPRAHAQSARGTFRACRR